MTRIVLGLDTSCYTTSAAVATAQPTGLRRSERRMLSVPLGGRGLRQSEAVFQHVQSLPALIKAALDGETPAAVCASTKPRDVAGSYMPVFTVGEAVGKSIASAVGVPFFEISHQQGHILAGLIGSALTSNEFLALHLSGGTTEALHCRMADSLPHAELLGGSADIHAGQLIDRVGVALGLPFPAGPHLERLALNVEAEALFPVSIKGLSCHFSGAENAAMRMIASSAPAERVAAEVFSFVTRSVARLLEQAQKAAPASEVLIAGGVAASAILRRDLPRRLEKLRVDLSLHYALPEYSGDNAAGAALAAIAFLDR